MLNVYQIQLGEFSNYSYIIADHTTNEAAVVDPAWDTDLINQFLSDKNLILKKILLTHGHFDHVQGVMDLKNKDIDIYINKNDLELASDSLQETNQILVGDKDEISLGEQFITVYLTPGHTEGSVCYKFDKYLFTGDTLFIHGCGRCDFSESNVQKMYSSLNKIKSMPDQTIIYPGHNYGNKSSDTLENQKKYNPFLLIDDPDFFTDYRLNIHKTYRNIPFTESSSEEISIYYNNWLLNNGLAK